MTESTRTHEIPETIEHPGLTKAYKQGWPRWAVERLIRTRTRRGLFQIRVQNQETLLTSLQQDRSAILVLANHSCWYDLFMYQMINDFLDLEGYGMMEHANLKKFAMFRRIGAFSADREDQGAIRASLRYMASLLSRPGHAIWIFPQGEIVGNDQRPLTFQPGLRALLRIAKRLRIVPIAMKFEFWQDERPEAFVRFGEAEWVDRSAAPTILSDYETKLTGVLDRLREDVIAQRSENFTPIMQGKTSVSQWWAETQRKYPILAGTR